MGSTLKNPFLLATVFQRTSYVIWALSLVYLVVSVQTIRFGDRNRLGSFPLTALFCLTFAAETFVRAGVLYLPGNPVVSGVFDLVKPIFDKHGASLGMGDVAQLAMKILGRDDGGVYLLFRCVSVSVAVFLLVNRLSVGSGSGPAPVRSRMYQLRTLLLVIGFAALSGMSAANCTSTFDQRRIHLEPTAKCVISVSENLNICMRGPIGLGDAMITLALLHASLSWSNPTWIGLQHALAFRWASAVLHMLELHLQNNLLEEVMSNKPNMSIKFEAIATLVQVAAVFLLFIPRFAARQPFATMVLMALLGGAGALISGRATLTAEMQHIALGTLGQVFVLFSSIAVFLTGGIGISFFMFSFVGAASVHAPWIRNVPIFNMS